jgi:hypothetical protein
VLEFSFELWTTNAELNDLILDLKLQGYQANRDFCYAFVPSWQNYRDGVGQHRSSTKFRFDDDRLNTWFQLKYGNRSKTQDDD